MTKHLSADVSLNETIIAQVGCAGKTIIELLTSSPLGMVKTNVTSMSSGSIV